MFDNHFLAFVTPKCTKGFPQKKSANSVQPFGQLQLTYTQIYKYMYIQAKSFMLQKIIVQNNVGDWNIQQNCTQCCSSFNQRGFFYTNPYPGILFSGTLPFQVFYSRVRSFSRYSILGNAPCAGILFSGTLSIQVFYSRSLSGNFLEKYTYFQVCIKPFNCKKIQFLEKKNEEIRKNTKN